MSRGSGIPSLGEKLLHDYLNQAALDVLCARGDISALQFQIC